MINFIKNWLQNYLFSSDRERLLEYKVARLEQIVEHYKAYAESSKNLADGLEADIIRIQAEHTKVLKYFVPVKCGSGNYWS